MAYGVRVVHTGYRALSRSVLAIAISISDIILIIPSGNISAPRYRTLD
jgi:hypothetical protein